MENIEVDIKGQFGNQAFQYAFARALQIKYGGTITLNLYNFEKYSPDYFNMALSGFKLADNVSFCRKKLPFYANEHNLFVHIAMRAFRDITYKVMSAKGVLLWNHSRRTVRLPEKDFPKVYAVGYWQDPRFFESIKETLILDFAPKKVGETALSFLEKFEKKNSVCVSIRRGDFLNERNRANFYICDKAYFLRAMAKISTQITKPMFVIFSDDIEAVKKEFSELPSNVIFEPDGLSISEKLFLMSKCKHFILSNSSFSWWAQFLCSSRDKLVLAPSRWYNTGDDKKGLLYSDDWEILTV